MTSKSPAERALDLFVYAPLGLALSARDLLPDLVEKGRKQLTGQVNSARFVGQFAVKQGSKQANKAFERARATAEATLTERLDAAGVDAGARNGAAAPPHAARPTSSAAARTAPPAVRPQPTQVRPTPTPAASPTPAAAQPAPAPEPVRAEPATPGVPAPLADTLAIPSYDSLSASQVVPRLSSLSPSELEAVREYEAAHRGRKTILNRIAQLS